MVDPSMMDPRAARRALDAVDRTLITLLRSIMEHPRFRALEANWRGLRHLVDRTAETGVAAADAAPVRIEVLSVTPSELRRELRSFAAGDEPPLLDRLYGDRHGGEGAEPFGLLVTDAAFGRAPDDIKDLGSLARMGAELSAPALAAVDPPLFGGADFRQVNALKPIERLFDGPEMTSLRGAREPLETRFLGLVLPRVLARPPHLAAVVTGDLTLTESVGEAAAADPVARLCWMSGVWPVAAALVREFVETGAWWGTDLITGGQLDSLATVTANDRGWQRACTVDVVISEQAVFLSRLGFITICGQYDTPDANILELPSFHRPGVYDREAATRGARAHAALPIVLLGARFATALQLRLMTIAGPAEAIAADIRAWLADYTEEGKAEEGGDDRPLSRAMVDVRPVPRTGERVLVVRLFPADEPASLVPIQLVLPLTG